MKLSYRDKVILIAIIIIVILALGFFFVIKPKMAEINTTGAQLEQKQKELDDLNAKIATLDDLKKSLENKVKEVETLQEQFLPEYETFQTDQYIYDILKDTPITINKVEMELPVADPVIPYIVHDSNPVAYDLKMNADLGNKLPQDIIDAYNDVTTYEAPAGTEVCLTKYTVEIGVADFDKLYTALDAIDEDEKAIYITEIGGDSEKDEETKLAKGDIVIYVLSVQPLDIEALNAQ